MKKVFVSGCFDVLHPGHLEFLRQAAQLGRLYVSVGRDQTVQALKGRPPVFTQRERLAMVRAVRWVAEAFLASGTGPLDFADDLRRIRPHVFVVNRDGHTVEKELLCRRLGIEYRVLARRAGWGLPPRSTTALVSAASMPYRLDLAGGWLDQPWVSRIAPGAVITVSIEPHPDFLGRSGLASSTRQTALRLWGLELPEGDEQGLARVLFACDNPPGTDFVSGSQDALGIVLPGANRLDYRGSYWPEHIESVRDETTLAWLERHLWLVPLGPRPAGYDVLAQVDLRRRWVQCLARAADACWQAIRQREARVLGQAMTAGFYAQCAMFPRMADAAVHQQIARLWDPPAASQGPGGMADLPGPPPLLPGPIPPNPCAVPPRPCSGSAPPGQGAIYGLKITGAGGGGYLIVVAEAPPVGALPVKIRRPRPGSIFAQEGACEELQ